MPRSTGERAVVEQLERERVDVDAVEAELPAALDAAFARDRPTVVEIPVDF